MRRTINISVPEEMHAYVLKQCRFGGSVSEYFRSLVRREQQRREDEASRPIPALMPLNEELIFAEALDQLEALKTILERRGAQ